MSIFEKTKAGNSDKISDSNASTLGRRSEHEEYVSDYYRRCRERCGVLPLLQFLGRRTLVATLFASTSLLLRQKPLA